MTAVVATAWLLRDSILVSATLTAVWLAVFAFVVWRNVLSKNDELDSVLAILNAET